MLLQAENLLDPQRVEIMVASSRHGKLLRLSGRLIGVCSSFMLLMKLGSLPVCGVELVNQPDIPLQ